MFLLFLEDLHGILEHLEVKHVHFVIFEDLLGLAIADD
jgi:hypothetical protein